MDRVNNITSGDIGNLYKITGTAMIDRSGIEVIEQSSILRGFRMTGKSTLLISLLKSSREVFQTMQ